MKKTLLLLLLVSNWTFAQEASYHLNGITTSPYDQALPLNNGFYYLNQSYNDAWQVFTSLSFLPENEQPGWKKIIGIPTDFSVGNMSIKPCHLSNHLIVSIQSAGCDKCFIMKTDFNGNIVWTKMMNYPVSWGDYGSNATPLYISEQDEILISLTPANMVVISKLDASGNLIFSKRFNSSGYEEDKNPGFSVLPTSDNGFLITMKAGSNPTITKINSNLQVSWSKKWSIDTYSHPKLSTTLPNGNYLVIGDGDMGTYFAELDPSGNMLSYKYNVVMPYPYLVNVLSNDVVEMIDFYNTSYTFNFSANTYSSTIHSPFIYGTPNYFDGNSSLLDQVNSNILVNMENDQMDCVTSETTQHELYELSFSNNSITNETITSDNYGEIGNFVPTIVTVNDISVTNTCYSLGIDETKVSGIKLYPNPATGGQTVNVEMDQVKNGAAVQITSLSGNIVQSIQMSGAEDQFSFAMENESGIYFVQILDAAGNVLATEKLIIE